MSIETTETTAIQPTNEETGGGQKIETEHPKMSELFDEGEAENEGGETAEGQETSEEGGASQLTALTAEDLKIPEGFTYEEDLGKNFLEVLNNEKLSRKELGQKLLDMYHSQQIKMLEGLKAADTENMKKYESELAQEKSEWLKACQADDEYGGQNWEAAQAVIDRGCREIATPEAVSLMQRYNLNTHPEIVRMFYRSGKLVSEDKSGISGNGSNKPKDAAMAIFGESLKEYHKRKGDI